MSAFSFSIALGSRSGIALTETAKFFRASAENAIEPLERPSASMWVTTRTLAPRFERSTRCSASLLARAMSEWRSWRGAAVVAASLATTPRSHPSSLA